MNMCCTSLCLCSKGEHQHGYAAVHHVRRLGCDPGLGLQRGQSADVSQLCPVMTAKSNRQMSMSHPLL